VNHERSKHNRNGSSATHYSKRRRSVSGIVVAVFLGTDLVLHATRVLPPWDQPMVNADAVLLLAAAHRVVYGVVAARSRHGSRLTGPCSMPRWAAL
jgi:hypothetical protein